MFPAGRWAEAFLNAAGDDVENGLAVLSRFESGVKTLPADTAARISGLAAAEEAAAFIEKALLAADGEKSAGGEAARAIVFFLVQRGRLKEIGKFNEAARHLADERAKIVNVLLEAAQAPEAAFLDSIEKALKEQSGASSVVIQVLVTPALLGGYRLTVGSEMRDFSLAGKLKQLETMLKK
jgi:F-type H+-transporting ATPase subunit delta